MGVNIESKDDDDGFSIFSVLTVEVSLVGGFWDLGWCEVKGGMGDGGIGGSRLCG